MPHTKLECSKVPGLTSQNHHMRTHRAAPAGEGRKHTTVSLETRYAGLQSAVQDLLNEGAMILIISPFNNPIWPVFKASPTGPLNY